MYLFSNKTSVNVPAKNLVQPKKKSESQSKGHENGNPELDTGTLFYDFCYSYEKVLINDS